MEYIYVFMGKRVAVSVVHYQECATHIVHVVVQSRFDLTETHNH